MKPSLPVQVWGEDLILQTVALRHKATARAMNFLEAYYLSRDELLALSKRHPETAIAIRIHAMWLALRREIVRLARERKSKGGALAGAASSLLDAIESGEVPAGVGALTLGNKTGERPPEMVEVGASGKLMESNDLAVRFEILGNALQEEKARSQQRFKRLDDATSEILASLRQIRAGVDMRELEATLDRKLAQAMLSVAAQTTTTTTRIALERAASPCASHHEHQSHNIHAGQPDIGRSLEDRVQDGVALASVSSPPPRAGRRRHRSSHRTAPHSRNEAPQVASNPLEA